MRFKSDRQRKAVMARLRAEKLRDKVWKGSEQWAIHRIGVNDGVTVLRNNPPWGRLKAPFVTFRIYKNGKLIEDDSPSYDDMRKIVRKLK